MMVSDLWDVLLSAAVNAWDRFRRRMIRVLGGFASEEYFEVLLRNSVRERYVSGFSDGTQYPALQIEAQANIALLENLKQYIHYAKDGNGITAFLTVFSSDE